ncbi:MAG TPA: twin-arginine translocase subunit TatC [Candidatus Dormibacteraeota bacterium]|nr:twin-arginine translocase subunit TatC [Candidatus Dormibacteraeota bacterium]
MALLNRVLQRGPRAAVPAVNDRMSVIEHLEALRRALIVSLVAWGVATFVAFFISGRVITFLVERAGIGHAIYLQPAGGVLLELKVAIYIGVVLASPVVIQQVWWFVSPGLHKHERRFILPLIAATIFFFAIGVSVAVFALPLYVRVLNSFAPAGVTYLADVNAFVSFVLLMVIGFGLVFELPVVLFVLGMLRIINSRWLRKNRPMWFLGLGIVAMLLTPGTDPVTPLIMFVPLYVFYEGASLLLRILRR